MEYSKINVLECIENQIDLGSIKNVICVSSPLWNFKCMYLP